MCTALGGTGLDRAVRERRGGGRKLGSICRSPNITLGSSSTAATSLRITAHMCLVNKTLQRCFTLHAGRFCTVLSIACAFRLHVPFDADKETPMISLLRPPLNTMEERHGMGRRGARRARPRHRRSTKTLRGGRNRDCFHYVFIINFH